ncbi:MAG: histidinol-phosphatase [Clostridiales bacterium]|nr:histidinol-phosphatase [Clostridiales bacterium]
MILSDYHVHTNYTDGSNSPEEMVLRAVDLGMKSLGFSEHAYVSFDPDCRLDLDQIGLYKREIKRLKEKYAGQIEILCGIEMDYDSQDDPYDYDYVIGSVHYLDVGGERYSVDVSPEETRICVNRLFGGDYDSYAEAYYEKVAALCEKWPVNIIGHFDLIRKYEISGACPDASSIRYRLAWQDAVKAICSKGSFEINTGAVARGYRKMPYPEPAILERLKALGGSVVISGDCHSKEALTAGFDVAQILAKEAGFGQLGFTDMAGNFHGQ